MSGTVGRQCKTCGFSKPCECTRYPQPTQRAEPADLRTPTEKERDAYAWAFHFLYGALLVALDTGTEVKDYAQGTEAVPYGVRHLPKIMREVDAELANRLSA